MAELQGFILECVVYLYVVYPLEGHTYCPNILLYQDAAAKLAVDKAIA